MHWSGLIQRRSLYSALRKAIEEISFIVPCWIMRKKVSIYDNFIILIPKIWQHTKVMGYSGGTQK